MTSTSHDPWIFFSMHARFAGSQFYGHLADCIAKDEFVRGLGAKAKPGQPPPNTLFAAVHYLLLRGARHELREFYPTLMKQAKSGDPFPAFRDFCIRHKNEIAHLVSTRVTNTNEVGRCSIINAGMRALAAQTNAPLQLIEIGASCGINMFWDRYAIDYRRGNESFLVNGDDAPLTVECELRGQNLPLLGPAPDIDRRIGLELHPVDLQNADDRDWQCALMWPDQPQRLVRMCKALESAMTYGPDIRHGDAVALLPQVLNEMPDGALCCYHTNVLYQFPQALREKLEQILLEESLRRPLWRLEFEGYEDDHNLTLFNYINGQVSGKILAQAHSHGTWLEWL